MKGNQSQRLFVTGTDTDVGKTVAAVCLINKLRQLGYRCVPLKPVAAGVSAPDEHVSHRYNGDALALMKASQSALPYHAVNPVLLGAAASPHIAAAEDKVDVSVKSTLERSQQALSTPADYHIIEGAGGWLVPINEAETMADLACAYKPKVVLVVGLKLGCLNHALLTAQAVKNSGLQLAGWIGVSILPDMPYQTENIQTLKSKLDTPMLSHIGFNQHHNPDQIYWDIDNLL